jgi:hypothetical protein
MIEQFLGKYGVRRQSVSRPTIGYQSDLQAPLGHRRREFLPPLLPTQQHGDRAGRRSGSHYGDADRRALLGQLPTSPKPTELTSAEPPPQNSVREVKMKEHGAAHLR